MPDGSALTLARLAVLRGDFIALTLQIGITHKAIRVQSQPTQLRGQAQQTRSLIDHFQSRESNATAGTVYRLQRASYGAYAPLSNPRG